MAFSTRCNTRAASGSVSRRAWETPGMGPRDPVLCRMTTDSIVFISLLGTV